VLPATAVDRRTLPPLNSSDQTRRAGATERRRKATSIPLTLALSIRLMKPRSSRPSVTATVKVT
jgi:hypothetical protein